MKSVSISIVFATLLCVAVAWTPMEDVHKHKTAMLEGHENGVRALDTCESIGDSCSTTTQCEKDHYLSDVRCVEGKCIDLTYVFPLDASCRNPDELGNSMKICVGGTCDGTENECVAKKLLGAACDSDGECVSGACLGDTTKSCGRKHGTKLSVGDDCSEPEDCATGWCEPNENDDTRGKCAKFDVGVACTYSRAKPVYNVCGYGHYCKYVNETLATCQPLEELGAYCNAEHACAFTVNEDDKIVTWGVCDQNECKQVGSLEDGAACDIGDACNSLACLDEKCRQMDNEVCREDRDCGTIGYAGEGTCACFDEPKCMPHAEITKNLLFKDLDTGDDGLELHDAVNDYWVCVNKHQCDGDPESIDLGTALESCVRTHCQTEAIAYMCHQNCNVNVDQRNVSYNCETNEPYGAGASASEDRVFDADDTVAESCPNAGVATGASVLAAVLSVAVVALVL